MKRRFSLTQLLAISVLFIVGIQLLLVFGAFFLYYKPTLQKNIQQMVLQGVTSSAENYQLRWGDEIVHSLKETAGADISDNVQRVFRQAIETHREVSGFLVYRAQTNVHAAAEHSESSDAHLVSVARVVREDVPARLPFEKQMTGLSDISKPIHVSEGDYVFVGNPILQNGEVVAYLVYIADVRVFAETGKRMSKGLGGILLLFILFQVICIIWLGKRLSKPLRMLVSCAVDIAGGNLSKEVEIGKGGTAEIASLGAAIQGIAQALQKQVALVKSLTIEASGVSRSIAMAMSQLAVSASQQAAAVSQTATTVEQMEISGKTVAEAAKRIVSAAKKSALASERGREAVQLSNSIITQIKSDSANIFAHSRALLSQLEEVGAIISSVNSVADQSKILAVNASIEAAKAGTFGAGFAVVAQEVQELAGQSQEATEQITRTLTSIRRSVGAMVKLAQDGEDRTAYGVTSIANTGAIVNDLSEAIQEASIVANEIDAAADQQSTGLSQIAAAMDEINLSANENQSISVDMEGSTMELTEALEALAVQVGTWTIREQEYNETA
ncbi:MAG: HAMP domain-containing protein [Deltaproteobacteria bacterium]|nr:HAMP domain-containing protein [Deltaproteobacteria bacterium]